MDKAELEDFLDILEAYKLKEVVRDSYNRYWDEKDEINYKRRETTAEHVYSTLKLADFFLTKEEEFADLDRLHVYELLMYHDDVEILTRDVGISQRGEREDKEKEEREALPQLADSYTNVLGDKLMWLDSEFRAKETEEAKFANAVDKMDSLVHELDYPQDWLPKGFDEDHVRKWFRPAFDYSPTFKNYFEGLMQYLNEQGHFEMEVSEGEGNNEGA